MKRRRLRDDAVRRTAVARLDPIEAYELGKTLVRSRLPLDGWIQALLDRGTEARDESTASGARIWAGWYRSGHRIKTLTVTTRVLTGEALILAETEHDVLDDANWKDLLDRFDRSPNPE